MKMGIQTDVEHRGALSHKEGSKRKRTCQSDEDKIAEECCVRCNEAETAGSGQSVGGTAPQILLWVFELKEKSSELTPSKKSRGIDEMRTSEETDTEELERVKRRHFWQVGPPCHFQEDLSALGPTGTTRRYRRRKDVKENTRLSA